MWKDKISSSNFATEIETGTVPRDRRRFSPSQCRYDRRTGGNAVLAKTKQAIDSLPIVIGQRPRSGRERICRKLGAPWGNITGLSALTAELAGKRLDLIRETFPKVSRIAALLPIRKTIRKSLK